jgi:hypothetical protein
MKRLNFFIAAIFSLILSSCAELTTILSGSGSGNALTSAEIIAGLKQALSVGTDSAVSRISKTNGYFLDELIRITLPPEAKTITDNLTKLPGGEKLVNDVILRINRAAEDAAKEAGPIFLGSIKSMTIQDGLSILKGGETAATDYLRTTTSSQLFDLYRPRIKTSIDKKLIGNVSTAESWNKLTSEWNKVANSIIGQVAGFKPVNVKLDEYLTQKALDGLFLKISEQERMIRTDPLARVTELLKKVFGARV